MLSELVADSRGDRLSIYFGAKFLMMDCPVNESAWEFLYTGLQFPPEPRSLILISLCRVHGGETRGPGQLPLA